MLLFLAKAILLTTVTFTDTLNACNAVKYVSSSHNVRKVFSSTHNSISIPRQVFCPENNNIATSHLALANLLSPCETIYSQYILLTFDFYSKLFRSPFSFSKISRSRTYHHLSSSAKFYLFLMILFNAILLYQPAQNVLIFNILPDFTLPCLY